MKMFPAYPYDNIFNVSVRATHRMSSFKKQLALPYIQRILENNPKNLESVERQWAHKNVKTTGLILKRF